LASRNGIHAVDGRNAGLNHFLGVNAAVRVDCGAYACGQGDKLGRGVNVPLMSR
jgi:hypothetical protein